MLNEQYYFFLEDKLKKRILNKKVAQKREETFSLFIYIFILYIFEYLLFI